MPLYSTRRLTTPRFDERTNHEKFLQRESRAKNEDARLLHRVQAALPDLQLLLDRYWDISSQPPTRDTMKYHTTEAEALKQKDVYIAKLLSELDRRTRMESALRLEIHKLKVIHHELQKEVAMHKRSRNALETTVKKLQDESTIIDKKVEEKIALVMKDFDNWKDRIMSESEAKEQDLRVELDLKVNEVVSLRAKLSGVMQTQLEEHKTQEERSVLDKRLVGDTIKRATTVVEENTEVQNTSSNQDLNELEKCRWDSGNTKEQWEHRPRSESSQGVSESEAISASINSLPAEQYKHYDS